MDNEILLLLLNKLDNIKDEIMFSIQFTDLKVLIMIREFVLENYAHLNITFQIDEIKNKTNIYIYKI